MDNNGTLHTSYLEPYASSVIRKQNICVLLLYLYLFQIVCDIFKHFDRY